ncbi:MAG TPA: sporulation protein YunB [Paenibacillaceae bacterium]|nr:sporulation protein YunB [Paenibacillaceae bacterium]
MLRRIRRRLSKRPIPTKYLFLFTLILFLALVTQTFYYIDKRLAPTIREIARFKVEQLANHAINDTLSKNIMQGSDFRQLVEFQKDEQGQIQSALFNNNEYSRIVSETIQHISPILEKMESEPLKLPLGQVLQSNLLASLGPTIPVNLVPFGDVQVKMETRIQDSGINMVLYTAVLVIETKVKIIIPFSTEPATIHSELPISNAMIVGNVPQFYYDGKGNVVGSEKPGVQAPTIIPPVQASTTVHP